MKAETLEWKQGFPYNIIEQIITLRREQFNFLKVFVLEKQFRALTIQLSSINCWRKSHDLFVQIGLISICVVLKWKYLFSIKMKNKKYHTSSEIL
jgi:hypothetical protein